MERGNAGSSFNARKVSSSLIVLDFVYGLSNRCRLLSGVPWCCAYSPIRFINTLVEIFKQILKEVDTHGILHVYVAIIFVYKPCNVGNYELVLMLTASVFKITCEKKREREISMVYWALYDNTDHVHQRMTLPS
jgi:hypothetical protein